ncbi:MAG: hypothetical protein PHQ04_07875 [Opitutaceae bacterium]|nr:hypothetical protein [Opitutaceae bacterium]
MVSEKSAYTRRRREGRAGDQRAARHLRAGFRRRFHLPATTDAEETTDYWHAREDPNPMEPKMDDLVRIPCAARALAFDGTRFWTSRREQNQFVSFLLQK